MNKPTLVIVFSACLLFGCSEGSSKSYTKGEQMAEKIYSQGIMVNPSALSVKETREKIENQLQTTKDKNDFIRGFSDKGEQIMLTHVQEMNKKMGAEVIKTADIKKMFKQMRDSYSE